MRNRALSIVLICSIPILLLYRPVNLPAQGKKGNKTLSEKHRKKCRTLRKQKKFEAALRECLRAEAASPAKGDYKAETAKVHKKMKNPAAAIASYQRALAQGYRYPWVHRNLGLIYLKQKKYEKARQELQNTLELAKRKLRGAEAAGSAKRIKYYKKAWASALGFEARIETKMGNYENAIKTARKAYELVPNASDYYLVASLSESLAWRGHLAINQGEFQKAVGYYEKSISVAQKNKIFAKFYKGWEIPRLNKMARELGGLGSYKPEYSHRILVYYLEHVDVDFRTLKGENVRSRHTIQADQKKRGKILQGVLKRWMEAASRGRYTLEFERISVNATVRDMLITPYRGYSTKTPEVRQPNLETLSPSQSKLFYKYRNEYDSYHFYWNGEGIATTANGGGKPYPYVPYQLYGAKRGYNSIPTNWLKNPGSYVLLLHEFFHTVESMSGIKPGHGFLKQKRRKFPGWRGQGQFSYFLYQFRNRLPLVTNGKHLKSRREWRNLNFLARYQRTISSEDIDANQKAITGVSVVNRERAYNHLKKAYVLRKKKDKRGFRRQVEKALQLNPSLPGALKESAHLNMKAKRYGNAEKLFGRLNKLRPAFWSLRNQGWIKQWKEKKPKEAIVIYERAIGLFPERVAASSVVMDLGRAYLESGEYTVALERFQTCRKSAKRIVNKKRYAQCTFWAGYTYGEKLQDSGQAANLIKEAVEAGYDNKFSRFYYRRYVTLNLSSGVSHGKGGGKLPGTPTGEKEKPVRKSRELIMD